MSIFVITGKPRHGKSYNLASRVPDWLYEYVKEQNDADVNDEDRFALDDSFPVGCIYPNFKLFPGKGALKKYPERIIGNLHNEMDLRNPTKLIFPWFYIQEWNLMKRRGRILCTEGQRYMNSRRWNELTEETELKLQWHGKEDLDLWIDVQSFSRLDVVLRELVEYVAIVKMTVGNPDNKTVLSIPGIPWVLKRSEITWLEPEFMEKYVAKSMTINPETGDFYEPTVPIENQEKFWHRKDIYAIYNTKEKPVSYTLPPARIRHKIEWCEDDNCPLYGKHTGHPLIHGKHLKDLDITPGMYPV